MDTNAHPTDAAIAEKCCTTMGYMTVTFSPKPPKEPSKNYIFMISKLVMKTGDTLLILFALSLLKANDLLPKAPTAWNNWSTGSDSPDTKATVS